MAFEAAVLLDDFDRANGTLWSDTWGDLRDGSGGTLAIDTNQVDAPSVAGGAIGYWRTSTYKQAEVVITLPVLPNGIGDAAWVNVRVTPSPTHNAAWSGVEFGIRSNNAGAFNFILERVANGSSVSASALLTNPGFDPGGGPFAASVGDQIGLRVVNNSYEGWHRYNGVWIQRLFTDYVEPGPGPGNIGFELQSLVARVDDFMGGEIPQEFVGEYVTRHLGSAGGGTW